MLREGVMEGDGEVQVVERGVLTRVLPAQANCLPGYKDAHITLVTSVTPKELRQWRASGPSAYSI
jgi:hypothetical protein